jgi:hypothetical protein
MIMTSSESRRAVIELLLNLRSSLMKQAYVEIALLYLSSSGQTAADIHTASEGQSREDLKPFFNVGK